MANDNGVQVENIEEKEEVHIPETWEALVENTPILTGLPEPKPAREFTFADACAFNEAHTELLAVYAAQERKRLDADNATAETAVSMVKERNKTVGHMLDFLKSIVPDPAGVDAWTTGMDPDIMFLAFLNVVTYYAGQLGKASESKASSTGTKQN